MLGRSLRPCIAVKVARRDYAKEASVGPEVVTTWHERPIRARPPRPHKVGRLTSKGPKFSFKSSESASELHKNLDTIQKARDKLRKDNIARVKPFERSGLPPLVAAGDVDGLLAIFGDSAAHFKSAGEMRRAAAHVVARLPLSAATPFAQRLLQLSGLESYGLEQPVLEQFAITLFRNGESEKAQQVLKALMMRKKTPSVFVYIAMIHAAIRSRELPQVLTAYTAMRSAQVKPTKQLFRLIWRVLFIARRTILRLQRPKDTNLPNLPPPAATHSVWTLPSEEAIHAMAKTLVVDMQAHGIPMTCQIFECRLECARTLQEIDNLKEEMVKLNIRRSVDVQRALVRAHIRMRRPDTALQLLLEQHWETERDYLSSIHTHFPSEKHKSGVHDLIEASYFYGLFDNAGHKWQSFLSDEDFQRPMTILAAMKAAASVGTPQRIEAVLRAMSKAAAQSPALWPTFLRAVAPVSRTLSLQLFVSMVKQVLEEGKKLKGPVFNDIMLALVNATDFRGALIVYKLMLTLQVPPNLRTFLLLAHVPSSISHLPLLKVFQEDMNKFAVPPTKVLLAEISRRVSHLTSNEYVDALAPIDDVALNLLYGAQAHVVKPEDILEILSASIAAAETPPHVANSSVPLHESSGEPQTP